MDHFKLLKNNKNIRILSCVQLIVYFGAWFSQTGVFTLLVELNAPTWAISTSAMLAFLPGILLAPINGVIIEKNTPKRLLISMASIELISIFLLIFVNDLSMLWFLFILIFARLCVGSIYFQAEMSLLAKILKPPELKLANEIHSIIWSLSYTAGMALAGIFIHFLSIKMAFLFDCFLLSIGIILLIGLKVPHFKSTLQGNFFLMIQKGLVYLYKNKKLLHLILLHAFMGFTSYETLVALLAKHEYKELLSAALVIGFLNAVRACSLVFGTMILSKITNERNLMYFYLGQGLGILLWAFTQYNFYLSFFGLFMTGFFTSSLWSYTYTLIQKNCDTKYFGRVIAYTDMIFLSCSAVVSVLIGVFFELAMNLQFITSLLGATFIIAGIYWAWFYRHYIH